LKRHPRRTSVIKDTKSRRARPGLGKLAFGRRNAYHSQVKLARLLALVAVAVAVVLPVRLWVAEPIYIASASMEPTLPVGLHALLDRVSLRLRPPRRGDIIVFRPPVGEGEDMVKRVIALPGDTVELRDKKVFLNGSEQSEPFVEHTRPAERLVGDNLGPLTVPPESYFVLGDNRDESRDSSVWLDAEGQRVYFVSGKDVRGLVRGFF
jgi:signal peptidase I